MDGLDSFMAIIGLNSGVFSRFCTGIRIHLYNGTSSVQSSGAKRANEQEVVGVVGIFVTSSAPVTALAAHKSAIGHWEKNNYLSGLSQPPAVIF